MGKRIPRQRINGPPSLGTGSSPRPGAHREGTEGVGEEGGGGGGGGGGALPADHVDGGGPARLANHPVLAHYSRILFII